MACVAYSCHRTIVYAAVGSGRVRGTEGSCTFLETLVFCCWANSFSNVVAFAGYIVTIVALSGAELSGLREPQEALHWTAFFFLVVAFSPFAIL